MSQTSGLGQVGNKFATFNTGIIVVLVNEEGFDSDENFVDIGPNQVVKLA
jgi:hypothetical protein